MDPSNADRVPIYHANFVGVTATNEEVGMAFAVRTDSMGIQTITDHRAIPQAVVYLSFSQARQLAVILEKATGAIERKIREEESKAQNG